MVSSQLLEAVFQGPKYSHHFEAIDVPFEKVTTPGSLGWAAVKYKSAIPVSTDELVLASPGRTGSIIRRFIFLRSLFINLRWHGEIKSATWGS